ncbi:hypothetical protein V8J88_17885 [Massilia sp. W12]|uniref:hypothetical protein n=1 Tax=Massilia sp. W12 TaxID=3126507 RepID=UPI0030D2AB47
MTDLVLTLKPQLLHNPDLDLRYAIPDILASRSHGNIQGAGFDYEEQEDGAAALLTIFLCVSDLPAALSIISAVLYSETVLENQLAPAAALYLQEGAQLTLLNLGDEKTWTL